MMMSSERKSEYSMKFKELESMRKTERAPNKQAATPAYCGIRFTAAFSIFTSHQYSKVLKQKTCNKVGSIYPLWFSSKLLESFQNFGGVRRWFQKHKNLSEFIYEPGYFESKECPRNPDTPQGVFQESGYLTRSPDTSQNVSHVLGYLKHSLWGIRTPRTLLIRGVP